MGRNPRIEFEGAVYHVMSRGNHQEAVFLDDHDNRIFLDTLDEACSRTGWRIHAFVLMGNHYHLLIETPNPNLVDGMRWLQGTYTKRFNIRNKKRGHLFQGRYKALLVDPEEDYFQTVSSYIHLNPVRVKGYNFEQSRLIDYRWSSYPFYLHPSNRPGWLVTERTFGSFGWIDDPSGRENYRLYIQKRVSEIAETDKPWEADERWSKIRRGWCFGGDGFRDAMVAALDGVMAGKRRDSFAGSESRRHDRLEAQRLLEEGLGRLGLCADELSSLKKSDPRKMAVAWLIRRNTVVRNEWISEQLHMGRVSKLSFFVKQVEDAGEGELFDLREKVKR
ncbi:MAG: transposase [Kiritimatiellaceae bacterium]|nr:transposase [Kiritimatiellaceae bacterium]